ncbi:hypothetical protein ATCC90586_007359 [Pythium insidiosum]|nr:hypothetical protein ATCC90586_007359 [Pythium insidiosum]
MTATSSAVAACLGVASALLRPEATPSSVCSKAALQTIVLEAHRLAHQTALPTSAAASADVRGLLRLLAGDVAPSLQLVEAEPIAGELGQGVGALETRLRRVGEHSVTASQRHEPPQQRPGNNVDEIVAMSRHTVDEEEPLGHRDANANRPRSPVSPSADKDTGDPQMDAEDEEEDTAQQGSVCTSRENALSIAIVPSLDAVADRVGVNAGEEDEAKQWSARWTAAVAPSPKASIFTFSRSPRRQFTPQFTIPNDDVEARKRRSSATGGSPSSTASPGETRASSASGMTPEPAFTLETTADSIAAPVAAMPIQEEDHGMLAAAAAVQAERPPRRSARDRYREKLGARVWWELEYQAAKVFGTSPSDHQHDDDDDVLMATMPTVRRASDSVHTFGGVPIRAPVATATAAAVAQPPHASEPELESFVVLEQPSTRHERLAELRQRKLQQLQKARDEALKKKVTTRVPVATAVPAPHQTAPAHTASAALPQTRGPARPSNRQLIQNAIEFTLLAGASLERARTAALQAVTASTCDNFVVLLKSAKELKFRALYEHRPGSSGEEASATVVRIYALSGSAPPVLIEDTIGQFFRYNSGKKEFTPIDARSFTMRTDACALRDALVFTKKTTSAWSKAIL